MHTGANLTYVAESALEDMYENMEFLTKSRNRHARANRNTALSWYDRS